MTISCGALVAGREGGCGSEAVVHGLVERVDECLREGVTLDLGVGWPCVAKLWLTICPSVWPTGSPGVWLIVCL